MARGKGRLKGIAMIRVFYGRLNAIHPQLPAFLAALVFSAAAGGIFETTFNNYLDDVFHLSAAQRGMLEFPRELPGLLCALGASILCFLPEAKVAGIAFGLVGVGMLGLAFCGSNWPMVVAFMVAWSAGTHLQMPVVPSITMGLATEQKRGKRLGQIGAVGRIGTILGCGVVWLLGRRSGSNYMLIFLIGAGVAFLSAVLMASLGKLGVQRQRPKLVAQRRYWLYYILETLHGARKQIFVTFGPWVLVKIFGEPPATFAKLWIVSAVGGLFFVPAVGQLIDIVGERAILMGEAVSLLGVCAMYGFAERIFPGRRLAVRVLYLSYMLDQLLFSVGMARNTYVSKIALSPEDVAPALSLGVSINHAVSMSVPTVGGLVWDAYGYQYVFIGALGVAVTILFFTSLVRVPRKPAVEASMAVDQEVGEA